jgi:hypothetical protein
MEAKCIKKVETLENQIKVSNFEILNQPVYFYPSTNDYFQLVLNKDSKACENSYENKCLNQNLQRGPTDKIFSSKNISLCPLCFMIDKF